MTRLDTRALDDMVARFQTELHQLASTIAHAVIKQELDRKRAAQEGKPRGTPGPRPKRPPARRKPAQGKRKPAQRPSAQLELMFAPKPDGSPEPPEAPI
jgi:hypothetical protein